MPSPTTTGSGLMSYPATVDTGQIQPWAIEAADITGGAGSAVLTANTVYLYLFELNATLTVASMRCRVGATGAGTVDLGIYDSGGNLLGHSGALTLTTNATNTLSLTATLSLGPGRYMMAMCPSTSTDTFFQRTALALGMSRCATATNTGTAGVLPATTGIVLTTITVCPIIACVVTGGAP